MIIKQKMIPAIIMATLFSFAILPSASSASSIADWARFARPAGFDVDVEMTDQEIKALIDTRKSENVSVLEIDSSLSGYLNETQFQAQLNFLGRVASFAKDKNIQSVVYYPSLEVITENGENKTHTMFKDHPEWVQKGIDGTPNVFYGSQEVWVEPGSESAWMSPNTGYKQYFIDRVKRLANIGIDGIWLDVPVYPSTGSAWAGSEPAAKTAFKAWSKSQGLNNGSGYNAPTSVNWNAANFKAWIRWRHENLADFLKDIQAAAHQVNPHFMIIVENFPTDYMDASETGLDGNYQRSKHNFFHVWEVDSLSNSKAMNWSSVEEFSNKITMYKWARAVDRENPSWGFSYGFKPVEAGVTMGAALTAGVSPFESQTPDMTKTIDTNFRSRWYGFIRDHQQALLNTPRVADVGVWYSSASRDFQDYKAGGGYGMYVTTTNPSSDPHWWASEASDSPLDKPHLGGYRGASHALIKSHIPFKVITDPGSPTTELATIKLLWLPSVAALSIESANAIKNFVTAGGTVFATGTLPGTLDAFGNARPNSLLKDVFNFPSGTSSPDRTNTYGQGVAIYAPSVRGVDMFTTDTDIETVNEALSRAQQLVKIHTQEKLIVNAPEGIHVEMGKKSNSKHYLYVLNYSGLKQPAISLPQQVALDYRAPKGYKVTSASVSTPNVNGQTGSIPVHQSAEQFYHLNVTVDQFALVELTLAPTTAAAPAPAPDLNWLDNDRKIAAKSGLDFIKNKMRHANQSPPLSYGIYTNLIDDNTITEIYAHGHHVTAEHMGLALRASACMGDTSLYDQSFRYVDEVMVDPVYNLVNWAVDRTRYKPYVALDDNWINSNAPLDDFRVIRGIIESTFTGNRPKAKQLTEDLLTGIYWTSVTDRNYHVTPQFPFYSEGLVGYAWDWNGTTDANLIPSSIATGVGKLTTSPIPIDYNDLYILGEAAKINPRWLPLLVSATDLLLDAETPLAPGIFYNGYQSNGTWTGDFENRDTTQGKHLKAIQTLWISLHLARASKFDSSILDQSRRNKALAAAQRSLDFFKNFYATHTRIPEYLTFSGTDVPNCTSPNNPVDCLSHTESNLINGEARIYAQVARLALLLNDTEFAKTLISQKILTDRISATSDPRYGLIGKSTTNTGDAESWNVLESVLTLCLEASKNTTSTPTLPKCELTSNPQTISQGDEVRLSWTLNSDVASSKIEGVNTNATQSFINLKPAQTTTYRMNVTGHDGLKSSCETTVTVNPISTDAPYCELDSDPSVTAGKEASLWWWVEDAVSATIDHNIGLIKKMPGGEVLIFPTQTQTYTLTATGKNGQKTICKKKIIVNPAPAIDPYCELGSDEPAEIVAGDAASLWWWVEDAASASINQGIGNVKMPEDYIEFFPTQTQTYTLTATGKSGHKVTCRQKIVVKSPAPYCELGADAVQIKSGEGTGLWWWIEDATSATIDQGIGNVAMPSEYLWFYPEQTKTYTLTTTGKEGQKTICKQKITVK